MRYHAFQPLTYQGLPHCAPPNPPPGAASRTPGGSARAWDTAATTGPQAAHCHPAWPPYVVSAGSRRLAGGRRHRVRGAGLLRRLRGAAAETGELLGAPVPAPEA